MITVARFKLKSMAEVRQMEEEPKTNINVFIRTRPLRAAASCIDSIEKDDKSINCRHTGSPSEEGL